MPKCSKCGKDVSTFVAENLTESMVCHDCKQIEHLKEESNREQILKQWEERLEFIDSRSVPIESCSIAFILEIIAIVGIAVAPLIGLVVGANSTPYHGCMIFVSLIFPALLLLGFSKLIEYSHTSARRLSRIEVLLEFVSECKDMQKCNPIPSSHHTSQPPDSPAAGSQGS
jgi:hypothetical protein